MNNAGVTSAGNFEDESVEDLQWIVDIDVRAVQHDRPRVVVGPDAHAVSLLSRVAPGRAGLVGRLTARFVD